MSGFERWTRLWDQRERADALAWVRILVPLTLLWDFFEVWQFGLDRVLWAPVEDGGLGPASRADPLILAYQWFGASVQTMHVLFALTVASAVALALGVFSRTSALILLVCYGQLEQLSPNADRAIDTLLRNILCILVFARAGETLSLGARWRRGRFLSDALVPAWPRYLIVAQLSLMYFFAGFAKSSQNWSFSTGYIALFYVLQQPHHVRFMIPHSLLATAYPLVQFGAFATVLWERGAILLPALLWLRATMAHDTRVHRWVNELRLLELWVVTGVIFHLSLALFLALGIFPWGCLALYPALAHPDTLRAWAMYGIRVLRLRGAGTTPQRAAT